MKIKKKIKTKENEIKWIERKLEKKGNKREREREREKR